MSVTKRLVGLLSLAVIGQLLSLCFSPCGVCLPVAFQNRRDEAMSAMANKRFQDAVQILKEAIAELGTNVEEADAADLKLLLAKAECGSGNQDAAQLLNAEAMKQCRRIFPADDVRLAGALTISAYISESGKDYQTAETSLRQAMAIYEKKHGLESPKLTIAMGQLALHYDCVKKDAEAEALWRKAIRQSETSLNATSRAELIGPFVVFLRKNDRISEANDFQQKQKQLEAVSSPVANGNEVMEGNRVVMELVQRGRYDEAIGQSKELLSAAPRYRPIQQQIVVALQKRMLEAQKSNELRVMKPALEEILLSAKDTVGPQDVYVSNLEHLLASLNLSLGDYSAAEECLKSCIQTRFRTLGPGHAETQESVKLKEIVLRKLGRTVEADKLSEWLVVANRERIESGIRQYSNNVGKMIEARWSQGGYGHAERRPGRPYVGFGLKIARDGKLLNLEIWTQSGHDEFNKRSANFVKSLAPFEKPPPSVPVPVHVNAVLSE